MTFTVTKHGCGICKQLYETQAQANECEARGFEDLDRGHVPMVGEIVECGTTYGWYPNPDTIWARKLVASEDAPFGSRYAGRAPDLDVARGGSRMYQRIFIVSKITLRGHRRIYHLYSPEPPQGSKVVYTSAGHYSMVLAEPNQERHEWMLANDAEWRDQEAGSGQLA